MGRVTQGEQSVGPETLPSVSICIPVHEESEQMVEAVESALQNTYPKLEVIVYSEFSDVMPTSVRMFAQRGVRFVGATVFDGNPRTHALERLLNEASGSLVFLMGADVELGPDAVGELVAQITAS